MPTYSVSANRLRRYKGSGSWTNDGASCGFQGGSSSAYRYAGEMRFPVSALGQNVQITSISISMYAASIGGVYDKTFGIMWGGATGNPYYWFTASSFYNATRTTYPTVGGDVFNNIANAAKSGGNITIGVYNSKASNYSSSNKYDHNYCRIDSATLNITYEIVPNIKYYTGSEWKTVRPYYYNGTGWQACSAKYYNGTEWKQC